VRTDKRAIISQLHPASILAYLAFHRSDKNPSIIDLNPILLQQGVQGRARHAQQLGGIGNMIMGKGQDPFDGGSFGNFPNRF